MDLRCISGCIAVFLTARLVSPRPLGPQPLLVPTLLFLLLSAIATVVSFAPLLSWARLEWFALAALAVVVGQGISSLKQVKILVFVLLLSAAGSVLRTAWQYVHGIGTEMVTISPETNLFQRGMRSGDIVQAINGLPTRTPRQWNQALKATQADKTLTVRIAREAPLRIFLVQIDSNDLQQWLSQPNAAVKRGRPPRAQGHFYHYIPYAGMLLQLALVVFGLLIGAWKQRTAIVWVLLMLFAGLSWALAATVTRTYMAALLLGCLFALWLMQKRIPTAAWLVLGLGFVVGTLWIQKERGLGWLAASDAGSEYRWLMWKDAPRLIAQHPLFGVGPDSAIEYGERWNLAAYKKYSLRSHFHSAFIELAVDCGLPCLLTWLWLMGGYLLYLGRSWRSARDWEWFPRGLYAGIFAGVIAFLLSSFVQYNLGDGEVMVLIWLFLGLTVALVRILGPHSRATLNAHEPRL